MRKYRNIKGNLQPKRILKYSEEWIEYRKKRGGNSVKVDHCDVDGDGFEDSIVRDWRSPALRKTQTCEVYVPPPELGPINLETAIKTASTGPNFLNAFVVEPQSGPINLTGEEALYSPGAGPSSLNISVVEPQQGPSSLQFILPPAGGPTSLSTLAIEPVTVDLRPYQAAGGGATGGGATPAYGVPTGATSFYGKGVPFSSGYNSDGEFIYTCQAPPYFMKPGSSGGYVRYNFYRWQTNMPGDKTSTLFRSEGPWPESGGTYYAKPSYQPDYG